MTTERIEIICPLINNHCLRDSCAFYDGQADEDKPKGKCILVRAMFSLSTWEK